MTSSHLTPVRLITQAIINYLSWQAAERVKEAATVYMKDIEGRKLNTNNKAPVPWLVMCNQMFNVTEIARVILCMSLYPDLNDKPAFVDLKTIQNFYESNGRQCKEEVENIRNAICNCLNANANLKGVIAQILRPERHPQSLLLPFVLLQMCHFVEYSKESKRAPFTSDGYYFGSRATPKIGQTPRTVPVLGALENNNPPEDNKLRPIELLTDVALTDMIPKPDDPNLKLSCPRNISTLAQANFELITQNPGKTVKAIADHNKTILDVWEGEFKLDVEKYKYPPTPDSNDDQKKKGRSKKTAKVDRKKPPEQQAVEETPTKTTTTTITGGEVESLNGLVSIEGTPVIATTTVTEVVAQVATKKKAATTNRNPSTTTSRVDSAVARKALKKMTEQKNSTELALRYTAVELSPTSQIPQKRVDALTKMWRHLNTVHEEIKKARTPTLPANVTDAHVAANHRNMANADAHLHQARVICEELTRQSGYRRRNSPAVYRQVGDDPHEGLSEFMSTLTKPKLSREGLVVSGTGIQLDALPNIQLEQIPSDTVTVAAGFGWTGTLTAERRINPADLEKCAIIFVLPNMRKLAAVIEDLRHDPKSFIKTKKKKKNWSKVGPALAADAYVEELGRQLTSWKNKGWQTNTKPNAHHLILVWKSYCDYVDNAIQIEQGYSNGIATTANGEDIESNATSIAMSEENSSR